jgi:hypothetical protein
LLGYTQISDLANAHPAALLSIAGIGKRRLIKIQQIVRSYGLTPKPLRPEPSGFAAAYRRLKQELE